MNNQTNTIKPFEEMSLLERHEFHKEQQRELYRQQKDEKIRMTKETERLKLKKAKQEYNRLHKEHKPKIWFSTKKAGANIQYI